MQLLTGQLKQLTISDTIIFVNFFQSFESAFANAKLIHVYQSTFQAVCGSAGVRGTLVTTHQLLRGAAEHILRFSCAQRWLLQPKLRYASPRGCYRHLCARMQGPRNQGNTLGTREPRGTVLAREDAGHRHTARCCGQATNGPHTDEW